MRHQFHTPNIVTIIESIEDIFPSYQSCLPLVGVRFILEDSALFIRSFIPSRSSFLPLNFCEMILEREVSPSRERRDEWRVKFFDLRRIFTYKYLAAFSAQRWFT